ncbi:MAG: hypothetical protein K2F78_04725 [Muribaculaceae bacterium]|nr:hypothetical protein [Muribaculaceae bacterium]
MLAGILVLAAAAIYALLALDAPHKSAPASECNPAELAAASQRGEQLAAKIAFTAAGSMERQRAIMSIRAMETEIRRAGFPTAADSFAAAAERRLIADLIIR